MMSEGLELREVGDLVIYDLVSSRVALQRILGRFDRIGRTKALDVHAFVPSGDVRADLSLEILRGMFGRS
jgi:hypothetical protein